MTITPTKSSIPPTIRFGTTQTPVAIINEFISRYAPTRSIMLLRAKMKKNRTDNPAPAPMPAMDNAPAASLLLEFKPADNPAAPPPIIRNKLTRPSITPRTMVQIQYQIHKKWAVEITANPNETPLIVLSASIARAIESPSMMCSFPFFVFS